MFHADDVDRQLCGERRSGKSLAHAGLSVEPVGKHGRVEPVARVGIGRIRQGERRPLLSRTVSAERDGRQAADRGGDDEAGRGRRRALDASGERDLRFFEIDQRRGRRQVEPEPGGERAVEGQEQPPCAIERQRDRRAFQADVERLEVEHMVVGDGDLEVEEKPARWAARHGRDREIEAREIGLREGQIEGSLEEVAEAFEAEGDLDPADLEREPAQKPGKAVEREVEVAEGRGEVGQFRQPPQRQHARQVEVKQFAECEIGSEPPAPQAAHEVEVEAQVAEGPALPFVEQALEIPGERFELEVQAVGKLGADVRQRHERQRDVEISEPVGRERAERRPGPVNARPVPCAEVGQPEQAADVEVGEVRDDVTEGEDVGQRQAGQRDVDVPEVEALEPVDEELEHVWQVGHREAAEPVDHLLQLHARLERELPRRRARRSWRQEEVGNRLGDRRRGRPRLGVWIGRVGRERVGDERADGESIGEGLGRGLELEHARGDRRAHRDLDHVCATAAGTQLRDREQTVGTGCSGWQRGDDRSGHRGLAVVDLHGERAECRPRFEGDIEREFHLRGGGGLEKEPVLVGGGARARGERRRRRRHHATGNRKGAGQAQLRRAAAGNVDRRPGGQDRSRVERRRFTPRHRERQRELKSLRLRIPRQAEVGDGRRRRTGRQRVAQHLDELVDRLEAGQAAVATQRLEDRFDLRGQVEDVADGAIDERNPEIPHELRHDALELHEIGGQAARVDVAELCKVERAARGGPERGWHELEGWQLGDRVEEVAGGHAEFQ